MQIRSMPTMTLEQARYEPRSNVSCGLTGETLAHPVAYLFDDIYDQVRAVAFSVLCNYSRKYGTLIERNTVGELRRARLRLSIRPLPRRVTASSSAPKMSATRCACTRIRATGL
eukprot:SAG31_NODE_14098_length_827_cov_1.409341_1_plen_114_part_00